MDFVADFADHRSDWPSRALSYTLAGRSAVGETAVVRSVEGAGHVQPVRVRGRRAERMIEVIEGKLEVYNLRQDMVFCAAVGRTCAVSVAHDSPEFNKIG